MATFDAVSGANGASVTSLTFSHTISGTNTYLVVLVTTRNSVTVSSVTYNSVAMTPLGSVNIIPTSTEDAFLFGLVAPTAGANNVVVTLSGASNCYSISISGSGVDQVTPTGTVATNNGNSAQASLTVAGATNDLAVAFAASGTAANLNATADSPAVTRRQDQAQNYSAGGCTDNGAASVAFGWGLGSTNWGMIGVALKGQAILPTDEDFWNVPIVQAQTTTVSIW